MSDQEFEDLATDIGEERTRELREAIARFLHSDDEQGFYKWRATLPEYERQYVHDLANRTLTARANGAPIQMYARSATYPEMVKMVESGHGLAQHRRMRGLTQEAVAQSVGVPQSVYALFESEAAPALDMLPSEALQQLANLLGCEITVRVSPQTP